MNIKDQNYFYSLHKLLLAFKESEETASYSVIDDSINFIANEVYFNQQDTIFFEVSEFFSIIRDYPLEKITLETHLKDDLRMSNQDKRFMRVPFNRYIKHQGGNKWVTNNECIACVSIGHCVELIKSKLS